MKKVIKISSLLLGLLITIFLGAAVSINIYRNSTQNDCDFDFLKNGANKVILFIGDGMGQNHIATAELALDSEMLFTSFPKQGVMTTYSRNTFWPTDSAASATALATGNKVYNTHVGSDFSKIYPSITEYAKSENLGVGIITTDTLAGATPAGFSAHAKTRSNTEEIINSQSKSNIDLFLGAGYETYINYKKDFEDNNYKFISNYNDLTDTSDKIIGVFEYINNYESTPNTPTLPLLTEYAINYLEANYPNGYFLLVEGAHIDKSNHSNDIAKMIAYLDEFDNSIELIYNIFKETNDVCLIVTADHESGGLKLPTTKAEISDQLYTTSKHTHKKVNYFIYQFENENINLIPSQIDNTDIFYIIKNILNI